MKYGIDIGHNCYPDLGAKGIEQEDMLTMEVGTKVIAKLRTLGHQVIECKPSRTWSVGSSLRYRCNVANANQVDTFVSIHFNSFNGQAHGAEVYAVSKAGQNIAKRVLECLVELGHHNRGVKDGSHLYVVKHTKMPAILVECCFCDSEKDMALYNAEAQANAIVLGLTGQVPPSSEPDRDRTVLELQQALNRLQIRDHQGKALDESGAMNEETTAATKHFQAVVDVTETGIAGATTWKAIEQILAKPILRKNHAGGPVVKYLQHRVGSEVDGIYGPATAATVEQLQEQKGLVVDGIVGPQTWEHLIG